MAQLPTVPSPGTPIGSIDVERIEAHVSQAIAAIDDLDQLMEWRAQAAALQAYLRGKKLNGPMLGAQRRVEARIGQLLGSPVQGTRTDLTSPCAVKLSSSDRQRFRTLARGLACGLSDDEWRSTREPLIALIMQKYPVPRHVPTFVTAQGSIHKPRSERVQEISELANSGARAAQIAKSLKLCEQQVRNIAQQASITLPDAAIGKMMRPHARRILEQTILGVSAYVDGLAILDDLKWPEFEALELSEWLTALASSIKGLQKLHHQLRGEHERSAKVAI